MKKNRIALFIVLLLASLVVYYMYTNTGSTIRAELRDFAISDTSSIDKIFLADKSGNEVLLEKKQNGDWTVNSHSKARPDAVSLLLYTMNAMEVRSPVAKAARDVIVKNMSAKAIKVEIYQHGALSKTYYVGGATQDQLGTYMYLQNSTVPFIMHIPGFDGYLTPRFIINEGEWKIKSVFAYKRGEISSITIQNIAQPDQSFSISKVQEDKYALLSWPDKKSLSYRDSGMIQSYLASYQFINYEKMLQNMARNQVDSILSKGPFMIIDGVSTQGSTTRVELFLKPAEENKSGHHDQNGKLLPFDPDRMIARINQDTTLVLVQYFVFDKLMATRSFLENPVQKTRK